MAAVIDLTEEGESPPALQTRYYAAGPSGHTGPSSSSRNNATASTSRRTIELGDSEPEDVGDDDNDNDIVFLRSERLHLPAQSHASGRDANHGAMFARLRHHAQTGDNGVFSRDVVGLPRAGPSNNLRLFSDDAPLRAHSAYTAPRTLPLPNAGNARNRRGGNTSGPGLDGRRAHQHQHQHQHQHHQQADQQDLFEGLFGGEAPVGPVPRGRGGRQQQQQQQGRFTGVFPPDFRAAQGINDDDDWFDRDYDPAQPGNDVGDNGDEERNRPRGALYQELLNAELHRNANALAAAQRQHQPQNGWFGQLRRYLGMHDGGWLGGGGGGGTERNGNYLPPPPAYPAGWQMGPGGTFNVRRKVKNYSVRASHPKFDKRRCKGFERDVVPPPELDETEQAAIEKGDDKENALPPSSLPTKKKDKGKGKAKAEDQDEVFSTVDSQTSTAAASAQLQEVPPLDLNTAAASASQSVIPAIPARKTRTIRAPVCASCLSPLFLNEPAKRRPHLLVCGHVVCASCIRAAKDRVEAWYDAQARAALQEALESDEDDEELPMPGGTAKWKGTDVNEKFEVVEGGDGEESESSNISVKTGMKRKRVGGATRAKGRLPAIAPVHDRDRKTRKPAAVTGLHRETQQPSRASNKGKGKAIPQDDGDDDDGEWKPDTVEDEGTTGTSTSGTTDDSEPSRKKARPDVTSTRPSRSSTRRGDGTIPNMRESPLEGEQDADEDDDVMNDGPRQPTSASNSRKGKGRASHLSIPLTAATDSGEKAEPVSKGKKGKQKAATAVEEDPNVDKEGIARINKEWMACPVVGCSGDTDLQSDIGSRKGAWEMFV